MLSNFANKSFFNFKIYINKQIEVTFHCSYSLIYYVKLEGGEKVILRIIPSDFYPLRDGPSTRHCQIVKAAFSPSLSVGYCSQTGSFWANLVRPEETFARLHFLLVKYAGRVSAPFFKLNRAVGNLPYHFFPYCLYFF